MKYIMAIDDSPTIRMTIEYAVKQFSIPILQAVNGSDALEKLAETKKDGNDVILFIVDVNMPVMDGITFVKKLRNIDKYTPILILTTESEEEKIQEGKAAGASGWILKPFQTADFRKTVEKFIR